MAGKKAQQPAIDKAAVMVAVIALVAVEHDGVRYEKDEEFELPSSAVTQLADVNAIKVVGEATEESSQSTSE